MKAQLAVHFIVAFDSICAIKTALLAAHRHLSWNDDELQNSAQYHEAKAERFADYVQGDDWL